jgi:hypothetical protein
MKKQARNHINRKLSESDGAPAKPTGAVSEEFVSETFDEPRLRCTFSSDWASDMERSAENYQAAGESIGLLFHMQFKMQQRSH